MRSKDEIIKDQRKEIERLRIVRDFLKDWVRQLSEGLDNCHKIMNEETEATVK